MTREEAIWYLQPIAESASLPRYAEALGMAIAALREQETVTNRNGLTNANQHVSNTSNALGGWISVEDKLPQETGEVCRVVNLMMDNGLETAGWLNDITGLGYFLDSRSSFIRQAPISRFTHWMPLPEPPKEEV